jgi:hypothetical protein
MIAFESSHLLATMRDNIRNKFIGHDIYNEYNRQKKKMIFRVLKKNNLNGFLI